MTLCRSLIAATLSLAGSLPAMAEEWTALVIGNPDRGVEHAAADAFFVSQSLQRAPGVEVHLVRDVTASELLGAIDAIAGAQRVIIYYSGALGPNGTVITKGDADPRLQLAAIQARTGGRELITLIETCSPNGGAGRALDGAGDLAGFVAVTAQDGACPENRRLTDDLIDLDRQGAVPLSEAITAEYRLGGVEGRTILFPEGSGGGSAASPFAVVDAAEPSTTLIGGGVTLVSDSVSPVSPVVTASPAVQSASSGGSSSGQVAVFLPPAAQQQAALPQAEGLPEPSIIVGFVEGVTEASFDTLEEDAGGDVAGTEIAYDNLEARRSLRDESPDLFETLVAGGAFDPPEALLETALQTELARMGCYTAGIDGMWGGGSRASVERYFAEVDGVTAETLEPTVGLFRQIIRQDEIECPEPVVVQSTTRSTSSGGSTARSTTTSRSSGSTSRSSSSSSSSSSSGGSSSGGSSGGSGGLGSTNLGGVFR